MQLIPWSLKELGNHNVIVVNFRLLMQSHFLPFYSRPFNENLAQSFYTQRCSCVHNDIINLGIRETWPKLPKNDQKTVIFGLRFSQTVHTVSSHAEMTIQKFLVILPQVRVLCPLCAMTSNWYVWDLINIAKISPKINQMTMK